MDGLYIGIMSGTSLDGIDIALCEIKDESFELLHSYEYDFEEDLKHDILSAINGFITLKIIGELDTRLGKFFAKAISTFISEKKIDKTKVKAIGLHGQTLWHEPDSKFAFSMQLGNASIVTVETGIKVVSDFRQKDIALGGQGAPFTPAFHKYLFSRLKANISVLNIGGIANISILSSKLLGYDTGCGNMLMDYWINKNKSLPYDKDGSWAKEGIVQEDLLKVMLAEPYFSKAAPKSTGRELFSGQWLEYKLKNFNNLRAVDVQATLLELSSKTIANEVNKSFTELLIVCGGGVNNKELMKRLEIALDDVEMTTSDECGVSSSYMEAMAFAWLAYKRLHKQIVHLKDVTGAKEDTILGCIYE